MLFCLCFALSFISKRFSTTNDQKHHKTTLDTTNDRNLTKLTSVPKYDYVHEHVEISAFFLNFLVYLGESKIFNFIPH